MSRNALCGFAVVASTLFFSSAAVSQRSVDPAGPAPVPAQVLTARRVFIGNGGSDSYGGESYFRRAYESFYRAIEDWGHYQIEDSTRFADVAFVIRFANPIVDRPDATNAHDPNREWIYDPQLDLSINDATTGLTLWRITEHIEPGDNRDDDNRHFDEAVTRLVDDVKRLTLSPEVAEQTNVIPPGAVRIEIRRRRLMHASVGALVGGLAGGFAGSRTANYACNDNFTLPLPGPYFPNTVSDFSPMPDLACDQRRAETKQRNAFIGTIGGAIIGSLIGWVWPVSF
jgi:hypothetical protein